ncbi:hypothetical protein [Kitasatospora sp. McL0602]|uniref:hypothetical protein n=1 Tax=Kitasatospora sp. McL0602 TaxID=3439530 RepID=UPI003F8888E8
MDLDLEARLARQEECLDALLRAVGLTWTEEHDPRVARLAAQHPLYPLYHRIGHKRQAAAQALTDDRALADRCYDQALRALLHDDDPNSPRHLVEALARTVGTRRLRAALEASDSPNAARALHWL